MNTISMTAFKEKLDGKAPLFVVDVRTAAEVHSERPDIPNLKNFSLNQVDTFDVPTDEAVYFICQTGNRSGQACQHLITKGLTNVISVEGGLTAWKQNQYPTVKTQGVFPVMRQVQIAAGSMILIGTLGALLVHPHFIWLATFVGAGLTFAGLSGFCGMAALLGRMPWNRTMQKSI